MPKHDYLFVDESGDPGYRLDDETGRLLSSGHYAAAVLHVCDDAFGHLNEHVAAFRYFSRMSRELKLPRGQDAAERLMEPIAMMAESSINLWASAVYLNKQSYTGRYLKATELRPQDPTMFRNYVLRRLLEHHFEEYSPQSSQYDLVLDRVEMTRDKQDNLYRYLAGNYDIPTPTHITHASSIYVDGLQIVHHIANGFRDCAFGTPVPDGLSFVSAQDITTLQDSRSGQE